MESECPELIREDLAADVLGVTPRFLQARRVRGGGPPYVKIGSAVRYRLSDLLAWIEANVRDSTRPLPDK